MHEIKEEDFDQERRWSYLVFQFANRQNYVSYVMQFQIFTENRMRISNFESLKERRTKGNREREMKSCSSEPRVKEVFEFFFS